MGKSFSPEEIYPYANTIVSIEESKLLKQFEYNILHNTKGLQEALNELNNINYFHTYRNAETNNYGIMLDGLMRDTFDLLRKISPAELICHILTLFYDMHNMKLVAKERFFGKRLEHLALDTGCYTLATIRSAAVRASDNILNNEILTAGFFEALNVKDMYDIDFILDRTYFRTLKKYAEILGIPAIIEFITERIDLYNISVYFQAHAMGNPEGYFVKAFSEQGSFPLAEWQWYTGGARDEVRNFPLWQKYRPIWANAEGRKQIFSELDVLIDNYLINKTKPGKLMAFGIEPICAYFYNKLMEIKNIRILLKGKESNFNAGEIKKRMRIPYEL